MERVKIEVFLREKTGKETAKKIRREKSIPAIVYGKDVNIPIKVPHQSLKILKSIHFSESAIIDMEIVNNDKKESYSVIIKDLQYHPLTEEIIHMDFMKVSLEEKIRVHVPVVLKGEPKGVKLGGTLEQILREIEVEGLPLDIPEKLELDVSNLEIGDSLHVRDIKVSDKLKVITPQEETIATVLAKEEEVVEEAPAEEAPQEPEVIKEKKEEKEEESKES
jgi:large subunit ribosomal protein L25